MAVCEGVGVGVGFGHMPCRLLVLGIITAVLCSRLGSTIFSNQEEEKAIILLGLVVYSVSISVN